jgi:endonuclease NucS-like protein
VSSAKCANWEAQEGEEMTQRTNAAPLVLKVGERTVTREQVLRAMEEFDEKKRDKVPDTQRGWFVRENEQRYPPKWLLKLATDDLLLSQFKGSEARKTLNELGFDLREVDVVDEVDDRDEVSGQAVEAIKFGLERDLQNALRNNMEQLEPGLKTSDQGKEQMVETGRIDISAEDRNGATVVIELKAGKAGRHAIGQILAYMGDFIEGKKPVRGILVAREFSPQAISAARVVPGLQLRKYSFKFAFEIVGAG